jgi:hypothetical protein
LRLGVFSQSEPVRCDGCPVRGAIQCAYSRIGIVPGLVVDRSEIGLRMRAIDGRS